MEALAGLMWWFTVRASCRCSDCQRRRGYLRQGDRDELARNVPGIRSGGGNMFRMAAHHGFLQQRSCKSFPTYGAYIASKAGFEGMVHVLANELRGRNITVNAVAPARCEPTCS